MLNEKGTKKSAQQSTQKTLNGKSTQKSAQKTLRKVILLNEVLKIVFLLKKAFPKKMILECTNIFKKVLKKAIQKAVKEKSSQKSAEKNTQKSCLAQEWAQKNNFSPKKRSKKFFLSKRSS